MSSTSREAQIAALKRLDAVYPNNLTFNPQVNVEPIDAGVLLYLQEHKLIEAEWVDSETPIWAKINARGRDYLAEDGGLSAVLGVVTIKIHADTIRELVTHSIEKAAVSPEEKHGLLEKLRNLPAQDLETLTVELVKAGLKHHGDIAQWFHAFVA